MHLLKCLLAFISIMTFASLHPATPEELITKANNSYLAGETAEKIADRQNLFNEALKAYTQLESEYHPNYGNGKLYYDIGNSYYQLEEYPMAVLYYYRALKLRPSDEKATFNLNAALKKLQITPTNDQTIFDQVLLFHTLFSLPERLQLFFIFALISFLLFYFYVRWPSSKIKSVVIISTTIALIFLISVCVTRFFSPIDAVIVKSTPLFRDAGEQYAKVKEQPVAAGNKVQVLEVLVEGKWLKILTPSGEIGFVPDETIRIL